MAIIVEVVAVPSSGKSTCIRDVHGRIKCFLKSPAEKGKANQELLKMFAKAIGCPLKNIELIQGATARKKRIKIAVDISMKELLTYLGLPIEEQNALF